MTAGIVLLEPATRLHKPFSASSSVIRPSYVCRPRLARFGTACSSAGGPNASDKGASSISSFSVEEFFKSSAAQLDPQGLLKEMADTKQPGSRGEVWLVAQLVLLGLLVFPPGPLEALVRLGGIGSIVAGLALVSAGQQSLGNSLSPFPEPRSDEHALITDGAYSYVRHPMYGGLLLLAFGLSAATGSDLRFAASFALFYVLDRKVELEEEALGKKYNEYSEYKKTAKRFVPYLY
jgi:protein-S-isoprenylcysteine O-methyltransferase Ste14